MKFAIVNRHGDSKFWGATQMRFKKNILVIIKPAMFQAIHRHVNVVAEFNDFDIANVVSTNPKFGFTFSDRFDSFRRI
jgi:hypothetical protein